MDKKILNKIIKNMPKYMNSKDKLNSGQLREAAKAFVNVLLNDLSHQEMLDTTNLIENKRTFLELDRFYKSNK